jgi:hypothetical protein
MNIDEELQRFWWYQLKYYPLNHTGTIWAQYDYMLWYLSNNPNLLTTKQLTTLRLTLGHRINPNYRFHNPQLTKNEQTELNKLHNLISKHPLETLTHPVPYIREWSKLVVNKNLKCPLNEKNKEYIQAYVGPFWTMHVIT